MREGVPPLSEEESNNLLDKINDCWDLIDNHHIERTWEFDDFQNALNFVNMAGAICEEEKSSRRIEIGWGRVKALI